MDRIQWDVMDGRFVPNLTFGPDVIAANRPHVSMGFEAHLMVDDPDSMLPRWVEAGCERANPPWVPRMLFRIPPRRRRIKICWA